MVLTTARDCKVLALFNNLRENRRSGSRVMLKTYVFYSCIQRPHLSQIAKNLLGVSFLTRADIAIYYHVWT